MSNKLNLQNGTTKIYLLMKDTGESLKDLKKTNLGNYHGRQTGSGDAGHFS